MYVIQTMDRDGKLIYRSINYKSEREAHKIYFRVRESFENYVDFKTQLIQVISESVNR